MYPNPKIIIEKDRDRLGAGMARLFSESARKSAASKGSFVVAVSGGSTPRLMHRLLAEEPLKSETPWDKIHIFWVDERCVPITDPDSNYGAAKEDLLDRVSLPPQQVHPMPIGYTPVDGASIYERELRTFFKIPCEGFPAFDMVILGIGEDGHTASLFPGQESFMESEKWVIAVEGGKPYVERITLTYPVLNHAGSIVFLASGKNKAAVVKSVIENSSANLPAQGVNPVNGTITWFMDEDAASLLTERKDFTDELSEKNNESIQANQLENIFVDKTCHNFERR